MSFFSLVARRLLRGTVFGTVYPPTPRDALPDSDSRHHALEQLRTYLSLLVFSRTSSEGQPAKSFSVPMGDVLIEQPDEPKGLNFPSIVVLPGRGTHEQVGLGPAWIDEATVDVYGKGSALLVLGEYIEPLTIEVYASHRAERRALMAGLKVALRPLEESSSLLLRLPHYYDQTASFTLLESQYIDDPDIIRGKRRGQFPVQLRVPEVALVDVVTLKPYVELEIGDTVSLD